MEFRKLGRTGVKVSPICLGTMNFGPETSQEDSFAIMESRKVMRIRIEEGEPTRIARVRIAVPSRQAGRGRRRS